VRVEAEILGHPQRAEHVEPVADEDDLLDPPALQRRVHGDEAGQRVVASPDGQECPPGHAVPAQEARARPRLGEEVAVELASSDDHERRDALRVQGPRVLEARPEDARGCPLELRRAHHHDGPGSRPVVLPADVLGDAHEAERPEDGSQDEPRQDDPAQAAARRGTPERNRSHERNYSNAAARRQNAPSAIGSCGPG
jgi:hypothetical protein